MLTDILPRNYKKLSKEMKATLADWSPATITTGITCSFHKVDVTLDAPPIVNPADLEALGLTDVCVFSFTINIEPFIPKTARLIHPEKRPKIYHFSTEFRFGTFVFDPDTGEAKPHDVHIISSWPPCENGTDFESEKFTHDFKPLRYREHHDFYVRAFYVWELDDKENGPGFDGQKKISVILKLPPGYDIDASPIMLLGHVMVANIRWADWSKRWKYLGFKQYLTRLQKPLSLAPPPESASQLLREHWWPEIQTFFPIELCDIYQLGAAMGWEGARATRGTSNLTPELAERHQWWLGMLTEDFQDNLPFIDGYGDVEEARQLRELAFDKIQLIRSKRQEEQAYLHLKGKKCV